MWSPRRVDIVQSAIIVLVLALALMCSTIKCLLCKWVGLFRMIWGGCDQIRLITLHVFCITVPADAPTDVSVIATSPFTIAISWSLPNTPNGVIVSYTSYISSSSDTSTRSQQLMDFVVGGLTPYERVSVRVSASTKIGEGPPSEPVIAYTQETSKSR